MYLPAFGGEIHKKEFNGKERKYLELYHIDLLSRTPIYEQLYKKIVELILKGELKANDRLPSVRELAKELGVNPNTVSKAYNQLENDKVIYTLAGRGSFVSEIKTDSIKDKAMADFDSAASEAMNAGIAEEELHRRLTALSAKISEGGNNSDRA